MDKANIIVHQKTNQIAQTYATKTSRSPSTLNQSIPEARCRREKRSLSKSTCRSQPRAFGPRARGGAPASPGPRLCLATSRHVGPRSLSRALRSAGDLSPDRVSYALLRKSRALALAARSAIFIDTDARPADLVARDTYMQMNWDNSRELPLSAAASPPPSSRAGALHFICVPPAAPPLFLERQCILACSPVLFADSNGRLFLDLCVSGE